MSNYIQMFRTSVGDIQEPVFKCLAEDECAVVLIEIWMVFVLILYFVTIILNNFLIAKVSSSYENFQQSAIFTRSKNQIHLIKEYLMYKEFFSKCGLTTMEPFNLITMFQKVETQTVDLWEGTTKTIKKHVSLKIQELSTKIFAQVSEIKAENKATNDKMQATNDKIDAVTIKMEAK